MSILRHIFIAKIAGGGGWAKPANLLPVVMTSEYVDRCYYI